MNDLPVFEASTQVHINPKGEVVAYKDYRIYNPGISLEPKIKEAAAVKTALEDIDLKTRKVEYKTQLFLFRDIDKKYMLRPVAHCRSGRVCNG